MKWIEYGVVVLGVVVAIYAGLLHVYKKGDAAGAARIQVQWDAAKLQAERERNQAVDAARAEEQRRTNEQARIADEATHQADAARDDARAAGDAADRLRARVAGLVAAGRAARNSATAGAGPTAGDPLDVLADVLGRADKRAGELAAYADATHIAGAACERAYDALSATRPTQRSNP
ncbi:DUF2514 family protein [Ralstonia insidiosa]|uniref:DUF2514 family protein n=2 Tax=Ralstonia insidiosa TaxID=190721 RepID=A0A848NVN6_9RALS|nr:DUF2514 family protein [Ralstonia insidiosa]